MAYGARLESVLGESPQGFESPILRHAHESPDQGTQVGAFVMRPPARRSRVARASLALAQKTRGVVEPRLSAASEAL